ncbi:MAG: exonuclease SbcCD subunit D C-terminal domain-containing protein, partial [Bacteroidaceae bacterium]|nr:exonuclease SbcCD subunit D C-terminal domain-containing protein [Bacteroidaceae bacterium]
LRRHNIYVRGTLRRDAEGEVDYAHHILPLAPRGATEAAVVCYALPFLRSADLPTGASVEAGLKAHFEGLDRALKASDFKGLPIVAAAHCYCSGTQVAMVEHSERLVIGGQDVIDDAVIPRHFAYTALGHLHKAQTVNDRDNVRYAGSPIALSFAEKDYQRSVATFTIHPDQTPVVGIVRYTPLVSLVSVPERRPGTPEEVLEALRKLPEPVSNPLRETWPYLEVNLKLTQPEPELQHKILTILQTKAVRFCRATTSAKRAANKGLNELPTLEGNLQQYQPIDIARQYYRDQFDEEMPKPLVERFGLAEEAIHA